MEKCLKLISVIILLCHSPLVKAQLVNAKNKPIVVAVVDTGLDQNLMSKKWVCKSGHKDFTNTSLQDNHGHGTHVSGTIDQYAKNYMIKSKSNLDKLDSIDANYCQIIIKYFDPTKTEQESFESSIKALSWAIKQKVDIINYSGGGVMYSSEEYAIIQEALNKGIKVVAAAGNEHKDLKLEPFYPAMYDKRIYVVGNLVNVHSRKIAASSNFGISVNTWELGSNVISRALNNEVSALTGTSMAAAVKSGKIIRNMLTSK